MDDVLQAALNRLQALLSTTVGLREPMAMSLATAGLNGRPSVRTVLLKTVDDQGVTFYTNTMSKKGRQLAENPYAALCIYFQDAHQQVQMEGRVEQVSDEEADAYWQSRRRGSQIGAWASRQSEALDDRQVLLDRVAKYEARFSGQAIERPAFWTGYRLIPDMIEFWQGHPDRLNQRDCYRLQEEGWSSCSKYP